MESRKYEGLLCTGILGCGGGRPHILYNEKTKKYVLWTDFGLPGYQVSTSYSPSAPFVKATARADLDPVHGRLKPADFSLEAISR
jgi:hypothetical protein